MLGEIGLAALQHEVAERFGGERLRAFAISAANSRFWEPPVKRAVLASGGPARQ